MASADDDATRATPHNFLRAGWRKFEFLRKAANGETTRSIATHYGVSIGYVNELKREFKGEIAAVAADIENEFAGLWIADKAKRLAEYARNAELAQRVIDQHEALRAEMDPDAPLSDDIVAKMTKVRDRALRSVAEEMGHLPSRVRINVGGDVAEMHLGDGFDTAAL